MPIDAIDFSGAVVHSSPRDIASWPITTRIERLTMRPGKDHGLSFAFSANRTWPDYTPPGWEGPIQYTVWAGVQVNAQWHVAGFIQMWRTRESTGAPILTQWQDWAYDHNRWGAMVDYRPKAGDRMLFFLSAGNARRGSAGPESDVTSVRERLNAVLIELPPGDLGDFVFDAGSTVVEPPPPVLSPTVAAGAAGAAPAEADLALVLAEIRRLGAQVQALTEAVLRLGASV